ncbi:MAG: hypothetical protein A3G18_11325 [Rhodospirillales bacterium RIFCSPLOWO2_12_FULL_58_28]|nr:MAG: hypothetical protein A3H92_10470 [Rhodospirillales bacterium RIFCSPLOWO2_02_FULL_58_16]OHC77780.1 MAG: hypothetical protein A3G18_11325 [Rhodospirillales bacterium RIFCSPLOWO2_12_FULL_58_28]
MEKSPRKKHKPRKVTAKSLENAAVYYLQRFASSSANFRRVMMRRVDRSARFHGTDRDEGAKMVDGLIRRFIDNGLLNDLAYAEALAGSRHRRGASRRTVFVKLKQKGLDDEIIRAAVDALADETDEPELAAAVILARRRRLGPFRPNNQRASLRDKDMAALARAGFGYDMVVKVIDAETALELEEEVETGQI